MKNIFIFRITTLIISLFLIGNEAVTARSESQSNDAYAKIRYTGAFDQKNLYNKYASLMKKLGCAENIALDANNSIDKNSQTQPSLNFPEISWSSDNPQDVEELAEFQQECLNILRSARNSTLIQPAFGAFNNLAFMGVANALIWSLLKDSVTIGFAGSGTIYTALESLKDSAEVGYNLIFKPDNVLENLENFFAQNKCFIPQVLWQKIIKEFISARQNELSRQQHINFLEFSLGFTIYKPKPVLHYKDDATAAKIKHELNSRIDHFFKNYDNKKDLNHIKINIAKFIDTLSDANISNDIRKAPRYVYLYGSGGIGKTHFVQTLAQWVDELIPNSVQFQDVIISSSVELEGTQDQPGAFLKILRNQLLANKQSSIVMIDEATWLNDGSMISPAKRIFNGDRSKLITSYFGSNMDGSGVSLHMPTMLIFVASNEKINDPALESRFDVVHYPTPVQDALVEHAYHIAQNSTILQQAHLLPCNKIDIAQWIAGLDAKHHNFRYVAGNVETFLLSASQEQAKSISAPAQKVTKVVAATVHKRKR